MADLNTNINQTMVVSTRSAVFGETAENYWKLVAPKSGAEARRNLDSKGISYKKTSSIGRLYELSYRVQRGLLVFDKYSFTELERICVRKHYKLPDNLAKGKIAARKELAQYLEAHDTYNTFDKFLDLPAELRVMIYKFHLQDLEATAENPEHLWAQPPITKVNKLIRAESLNLFHNTCNFTLKFQQTWNTMYEPSLTNSLNEWCRLDQRFLMMARIYPIRHLRIFGQMWVITSQLSNWLIVIDAQTKVIRLDPVESMYHPLLWGDEGFEVVRSGLERRVKKLIEECRDERGSILLTSGVRDGILRLYNNV
ncbi:hypothetical protein CKM354_000090900 [Cercospora kikuchii]|uniref:Uncharacterized protein n=1 Tax=Cercospora kikuchii TaxID=84275 RepID=A0A9P3C4S6_9PEZI|nr:uncharacterized protein CKM354_000090900 [Cercospora kikuchii]GIZ37464.1 hypothetical protein CKM354_000090900 [Cercospora kikuchii]